MMLYNLVGLDVIFTKKKKKRAVILNRWIETEVKKMSFSNRIHIDKASRQQLYLVTILKIA